MKKKIIFTVTNDITYDQRMDRICNTLHHNKYEILLIGRGFKSSTDLNKSYQTKRIYLLFNKGKLFYIEYNIRLFFYLLFKKVDIMCAIDLDTITPNFIVSKLKKKTFVYDSHEYFTEMIEIVKRPFIKKIWERVESFILPKTKFAYTVNQSIADIYKQKYGVDFKVIRNAAVLEKEDVTKKIETPYLIYIGAVNEGRGLEKIIEAMLHVPMDLLICGEGDLYDDLQKQVKELGLIEKVKFMGYVQPGKLKKITANAYLGYLLLEKESLSYYYSLANKFYDYIHAEIPQITSNFPEYTRLNETYNIAKLVKLDVNQIIKVTNELINNEALYNELKQNTKRAKQDLNWQVEEKKLIDFYAKIE